MKIVKLYNRYHLGDQVFNFIFFHYIKEYLEENDIMIHYHCDQQYHSQVQEFNCSENIKLFGLNENLDGALHVWIADSIYDMSWYKFYHEVKHKLNFFYVDWFNEVLQKLQIPIKVPTLEYTDPDLLVRYERINQRCNNKYDQLDFLILNSTAMSGQYTRNDAEWNPLIQKLHQKYKIATTEPVPGIPCTQEDGLTVKDIAAVSTKTRKIIAVNSGVVPGLFNTYTLNNMEVMYTFSISDAYDRPKIISGTNILDLYCLGEP